MNLRVSSQNLQFDPPTIKHKEVTTFINMTQSSRDFIIFIILFNSLFDNKNIILHDPWGLTTFSRSDNANFK